MPSHVRRRLPLWIALVVAVTIAVIAGTGYFELHRSITESVSSRLEVAAGEISTLLQAAFARGTAATSQLARSPSVVAVLADETEANKRAALATLAARPATPKFASVAVWSFDGKLIVSDGDSSLTSLVTPKRFPGVGDTGGVSTVLRADSGFAYGVASPVKIRGQTVGLVIGAVHSAPNAATATNNTAVIAKLVGKDARVMITNAAADVWIDLSRVVPGPVAHPSERLSEFTDGNGIASVGRATPVKHSPWLIWIQMPEESSSVGAVHAFRTRSLLIAIGIGILGILVAWLVVRRVSRESTMAELAERARLLEDKNRALEYSELRYRQLVDHSPEAVIVHTATRITFANPRALELLGGVGREQVIGKSILEFLHPEDRASGVDVVGLAAKPGEPTPLVEARIVRPDKSESRVEITSMGVALDGETAVQSILRDTTERHLLEEQFRQSQKMEAVGRLAGGIAHDFNNLLTVIHTYTEITLASTDPKDARHGDLSEVMHATRSAAALTRQMLAFSRKQVLDPQKADLNSAISGVAGMIKRVIGEHIDVSTNLCEDVAPIWADVGQLEQVLMNLSVNARDAMPNGGLLTIGTSNVKLDSGYSSHHGQPIPAGNYVLLTVADTGTGMSEAVQKQIFDPFFTTKESGRGTGLGLSTVYGIVKQSDGHIWVYSEEGRGTVFKIYFPRYAGEAETQEYPVVERAPASSDRPARVLLVEDEPHVRAAVRRVLESRGAQVTEADRPSRAVSIFSQPDADFDLVITDMMMPEKNGAELVRELTVLKPDLRAVIMSGYSEEATSRQWRLPPNALFIEKPIAPGELFKRMDALLGLVEA